MIVLYMVIPIVFIWNYFFEEKKYNIYSLFKKKKKKKKLHIVILKLITNKVLESEAQINYFIWYILFINSILLNKKESFF